jgi:hypothetical protein
LSLFISLPFICIFHLHARTPIRFFFLFTRGAIPQVRILGVYLVCWKLFPLPTITPGVECAYYLFLQAWKIVPMSSWPIAIKIISNLQGLRGKSLFPSRFGHMFRDVQLKKSNIQKILQISFPTHQASSNLKTRTRRYGKNIERCAVWNQPWTDCIARVK